MVIDSNRCSRPDSVTIVVNPTPIGTTGISAAAICKGDNIQLTSSGGIFYKWIPSTGLSSSVIANPVASPADTTDYMVIISNQFNCSDTERVTINVIEKPKADAGPDKYILEGNSIKFRGNASGQNINYSWSPAAYMDDPMSLQPVVTPPADLDYVLTATSNEGCGAHSDTMHVFVYKDIFVPNAFTPNGDGKNDAWFVPILSAFNEFEVSVYNRYGQMVFYTKNVNKPWDGKYKGALLSSDAYVYVIKFKELKRLYKGTVIIIR
jgi:gliding motility-associated-like protein